MAEISAAMVKQLRDRTDQAMMDCKKALVEAAGDLEKAVDILRKKGMAVMEKRAGRDTNEGKIVGRIADDGKTAVITMLCSETDFTSKNDSFVAAAELVAEALLAADAEPASAQDLMQLTADGKKVGDVVNDIISTTGEKITLGDFARFQLEGAGLLHCYVHFNGKVGTLVQIIADSDAAASAPAVTQLAADIAMHVTATNSAAVAREEVDPETVAREREVAAEQVKDKPANMIDKIVEGKLNKWFQQIVLVEQPFVKDDSMTVAELLDKVGKDVGGKLTVKRFARIQIG